jgi:hypothetical protein
VDVGEKDRDAVEEEFVLELRVERILTRIVGERREEVSFLVRENVEEVFRECL